MTIGERFKLIRNKSNIEPVEFSKKLGISYQSLNHYENNYRNISDEVKSILYKDYNINLNWLLTGEGTMFIDNAAISKIPLSEMPCL